MSPRGLSRRTGGHPPSSGILLIYWAVGYSLFSELHSATGCLRVKSGMQRSYIVKDKHTRDVISRLVLHRDACSADPSIVLQLPLWLTMSASVHPLESITELCSAAPAEGPL